MYISNANIKLPIDCRQIEKISREPDGMKAKIHSPRSKIIGKFLSMANERDVHMTLFDFI